MFRSGPAILALTIAYSTNAPPSPSAMILNWNIDCGQHFKGIAAAMRETHPDLCIFQEVDLGARRTHGEDVAQELAKTFGMNYTFAPEFRELGQSTAEGPAYHGQAILTRLPIRSSRILRFTHQSGFWKPRPLLISSLPYYAEACGRANCSCKRIGSQWQFADSLQLAFGKAAPGSTGGYSSLTKCWRTHKSIRPAHR
jgi:hypothetical protein